MPKIYYRTSYTAISTFYWESIIHLFSWKTWKLSVKLSWDLSITGQRRRRLGEWAIGLCCMWVIDWTINQSHTLCENTTLRRLLACCIAASSVVRAYAQPRLKSWRGPRVGWMPTPFLFFLCSFSVSPYCFTRVSPIPFPILFFRSPLKFG